MRVRDATRTRAEIRAVRLFLVAPYGAGVLRLSLWDGEEKHWFGGILPFASPRQRTAFCAAAWKDMALGVT